MKDYFDGIDKWPILGIFMPWRNFSRASPLLWIFLGALAVWTIGASTGFLWGLAWIGGFLVAFFIAVALALFESL